jgi:hypothetical protein
MVQDTETPHLPLVGALNALRGLRRYDSSKYLAGDRSQRTHGGEQHNRSSEARTGGRMEKCRHMKITVESKRKEVAVSKLFAGESSISKTRK